jgi:hypothetical protein
MLKPANEPMQGGDEERPIGEIVSQLVDEGKAYAKAELDLARAQAEAKVAQYKVPAILLGAALLLALAALTALAVTMVLSLATLVGPLAGGLIAVAATGGAAYGLYWLAMQKLKAAK